METIVVPAINYLLRQEPWALERLRPFVGKTMSVAIDPVATLRLRVNPDGFVERAGEVVAPDLAITVAASALPAALHDKSALLKGAHIEGDAEFASAGRAVAGGVRWDIEDDLARIIGDIAARRVVQAGSAAIDWQREAADRLARNVSEYAIYEAKLTASRAEVASLAERSAALVRRIDELDARIARLETRTRVG